VLIALCLMVGVVTCLFALQLGSWTDGFLLSSGAFFTFGAKAELLAKMGAFENFVYIFSAFCGVSLVALFVTVLASVLLKDN
jgi:hypothetical protein